MSETVFYSPEFNEIFVHEKSSGFIFKDKNGEFHLKYFLGEFKVNGKVYEPFYTFQAYVIGEL